MEVEVEVQVGRLIVATSALLLLHQQQQLHQQRQQHSKGRGKSHISLINIHSRLRTCRRNQIRCHNKDSALHLHLPPSLHSSMSLLLEARSPLLSSRDRDRCKETDRCRCRCIRTLTHTHKAPMQTWRNGCRTQRIDFQPTLLLVSPLPISPSSPLHSAAPLLLLAHLSIRHIFATLSRLYPSPHQWACLFSHNITLKLPSVQTCIALMRC